MKAINPHIARARLAHHQALAVLAGQPDGLSLWRKLRRIEGNVSKFTVAHCNGEISQELADRECRKALCAVVKLLGHKPDGLFINRDPRGYALKLDNDTMVIPVGLHTDFGGFGILAPEIN